MQSTLSKDTNYQQAAWLPAKQCADEALPAINMMIDTWVHMIQAGRLPVGRSSHKNNA